MQDLRFYNFDFTLLHIEHDFSSVYWNLKYNAVGSFEAEFACKDELNKLCSEEKYLVVCQGDRQAIITGRQIKNNKLKLFGRTVNFLLEKRVLMPFSTENLDSKKGSASLAQYIVSETCADFAVLGSTVISDNDISFERSVMTTVENAVRDCLESDGLGHRLVFDTENKKWVFDIIQGRKSDLVVSEDMLNAFESEYTHSLLDFCTSGYYRRDYNFKGDWNPVSNSPALSNNTSENYASAYRATADAEIFNLSINKGDYIICNTPDGKWQKSDKADGFDVYIPGTYKGAKCWDAIFNSDTESEALEILEKNKLTEKCSANMRNLEFGKDFKLGDIVTFNQKIGKDLISLNLKITSVTLWFEQGSAMGVKPEFTQI
ncbi:MAG: hypothetical protein J6A69_12380 [Clostridia bacterium]|nr:hypothetical protein [Clostridia bacterium]